MSKSVPPAPRSASTQALPKQLKLLEIENAEKRRCDEDIEEMTIEVKADNTEIAYRSGWRMFTNWCLKNKYKPLPASFEALQQFVRHLVKEQTLRMATIRGRLSAIQHYHVAAGEADPVDARIRRMVSNVAKRRKERNHHKIPVTPDQVLAVLAAYPGYNPNTVRNRALFLLLYATGWRRSEMRTLDMDDVSFHNAEGVTFSIGASKSDQNAKGREVSVPYDDEPAHCPVRHLEAWIKARGKKAGPLFCPVAKGNHIKYTRLGGRAICTIVQAMLRRAGVKEPTKYGAHSLRSGMITAAHLAGANEKDIMHSTGHTSILSMWHYIRPVGGFERYPLRGVLAKAKGRKASAA